MKTTKSIFLTLLITLLCMSAKAQQRNVLIVPDVITQIGNVQLPINIENTDEVVGMQFDITLPEGITAQPVANLTNRSDGHIANVSKLKSGAYRILLYSGTNRPLLGQSGVVMYLPIVIPDSYEEGSEHQITISNATLGKSSGENVITEAIAGKIRISKLPDLTIKNVIIDKQVLSPGERVVCSWQVENIGELDTDGGWSEQLSLVSNDGTISKLIATTHYDDILTAGGIVSRQTEVTLPYLLAIDGDVKLQVRLVPDINTGEPASAQANNTQTCDNFLTVNKQLGIELSPKRIDENSGQRIALRVNRSGRWTTKETFAITATNDSRLNVPSSITIPANQSGAVVYISVTDNEVLDNDSIVNISVEGNGYAEATSTLVIDDNELPTLSVSSSKTEVNEGETFQLTITTSRTSSSPIVVKLTSESSRRFTFPQQVVIPANESSVTIDVVAVDNDEIELKESIAFRALADKHESGECIIMLDDNDMPTLSFTLSPEAVCESDGYAALLGVIKRTDNLDKKVTLKLSDDSNGLLTYSSQSIVLAKNQAEVQFSIGVTDNDIVDGNHIVNVTAAVYASSCDCSVSGDNKGYMTATVTIIDDDGPTLKIKPAGTAMLEGSEGNVFAVSHNVQSDVDVTVHISSDKDDMLEYNHELTIPAGQGSANLKVSVKGNDLQDDSSIATFKAESNGYSLGTCWILITDQTLPDATVSLYADKTEVEAEQTVFLRAVVKNMGNAPLRSTTPLEISFSGKSEKVKLTVGKNVAVGDSAIIEYNYDLPAITGEHIFEATVNASGKVPELIYANNTSEKLSLSIIPPFSVTAQADKDIYHQSDSIYISGKATGSAGRNSKIEVYFINEGSRLTVNATSDDEGNFIAVWKPLSKQSGHFIVGACYPGSKATEEMDAFDVYGVRTKDYFKTCELSQSESTSGKIMLTNPGNLAQTGLKVTPKVESENCEFTFDAPTAIEAGESVEISYSLKANEISEGKDWQQMPIEITTAEGSITNYTIYYYVHSLKARIEASKTSINTTMTYGTPREYPVTIRNVGKAETGKITLSLPNWIQTVTPSEMASLAQGDSATVLLRFIPTEAMKLNVRVSGRIGINCANGDGTSISFNLTPVSEAKGKLKVDVVDEYTYFTTEAPHVSKAKVSVKNPSTNEVVAEGETADDGTFTAEIPEGYYSVTVDADKHNSYANTVIVDPGVEKEEEVFLSYQAITYSWNVEETTVEDEYEIETIVKYETRVPKPVVIVTLPDEQPEPNSIIPVIVTNKGLVNAVDVNMSLSISNDYALEFINDPTLEVLAPQQAHVFYAKMVPEGANKAKARMEEANGFSRCYTLIARAKYKELCKKYTGEELAEAIKKWGTRECLSSSSSSSHGGGYSYGPGSPSLWGNSNYGGYYKIDDMDDPAKFCDQALNNDDGDNDDDEEEPEESSCDEKPTLNYKLVSNDEKHKVMKGVAADGVSQVKIVLGTNSAIPPSDCNFQCKWTLSENIGKLDNETSWNNVVYTAPEDYPLDKNGASFTIQAKLTYSNGEINDSAVVNIKIIRTPVLFVHGLHDKGTTWNKMIKYLTKEGLYSNYQLIAANYERTHNETFATNVGIVSTYAKNLMNLVKRNGYVSTKIDAVGHSMGGLLIKKSVQEDGGNEFIRKAITMNTPHGGSQLGNFLNDPRVKFVRDIKDVYEESYIYNNGMIMPYYVSITPHPVSRSILKKIYQEFGPISGDISNGAVSDLSVGGAAINSINNNSTNSVRCHAITTTTNSLVRTLFDNVFAAFEYSSGDDFLNELYNSDSSDLIVPLNSQKGGLESPCISMFSAGWGLHSWEYFHSNTCESDNVMHRVGEILQSDIHSNVFSNGFNSTSNIIYNMPTLDKVKTIYTESNSILPNNTVRGKVLQSNRTKKTIDSSISMSLSYELNSMDNTISVKINTEGEFSFVGFGGFYKEQIIGYEPSDQGVLNLPEKIDGDIIIMYEGRSVNGGWYSNSDTIRVNTIGSAQIDRITFDVDTIYTFENAYTNPQVFAVWSDGQQTELNDVELIVENNTIAEILNERQLVGKVNGFTNIIARYQQFECNVPILSYILNSDNDDNKTDVDDDSPSICSTVTLSFKQKNVMTRQAFRGTLTVNNGNETTAMKDVKMNLEVRDMDGNLTTSHEFQIDAESLNGFTGNLDFNSGWTLGGGETGTATVLFIPTKYAAPTEPKDYSFGGSFSYTDPYTGLTVTRDLNPVTLTVNPSPNLEMTYFMQRDVFGDDPLTETIEPMAPSEFALVVNNKGYGDAENMSLTTHQPEIIDNQKGLAISFELISTQLNGGEKNLSLGGSMTSDFGTIPAHSQSYAQWWLQSSLLGHFIEYNVKATHITSRNNPDLSLIDTVTIHELVHGFTVKTDGDKPLRGFLVNDIKDKEDLPDVIYFTDATQQSMYITTNANIMKQSDTEYVLNVGVANAGWNYGSLLDPTYGKQKLLKVTRADGTEVNVDNIWQTNCTLRDGKDPIYEKRIHFVGNMSSGGELFYLIFEPKPDVELNVENFIGVPEEGNVLKEQLTSMIVKFNKPVKSDSFTPEDIVLTCQGVSQDTSQITIEQINEHEFRLMLNEVTLLDGYYVLTVQTIGIEDNEGFNGSTGKQTSWIQFVDGKVALKLTASPTNGGTISPTSGRFDYDSAITLKATANEGYNFEGWTQDGQTISSENEFAYHITDNAELKALFSIMYYNVSIDYDSTMGVVEGAASGIYEHGTLLQLTATPSKGFEFDAWVINDERVSESEHFSISTNEDVTINALFKELPSNATILQLNLVKGWNWISSNLSEYEHRNAITFLIPIEDVAERLMGQTTELYSDPELGLVGNLERINPSEGYKLLVSEPVQNSWNGIASLTDSTLIQLHKGWNWIGYVPICSLEINEALAGLEASENDVLKTLDAFAIYSDGRWSGTLEIMNQGVGYMYYSGKNTTFKYPYKNVYSILPEPSMSAKIIHASPWQYNPNAYSDNKTIIAEVYDDSGKALEGVYSVGAFVGKECRGMGKYVDGLLYLTVHGTIADNEKITFKAYENATSNEFSVKETLEMDGVQTGTVKAPFVFHTSNTTGISKVTSFLNIYPNPVRNTMYINGDTDLIEDIKILSSNGSVVYSANKYNPEGIDVTALLSGVYIVALKTNEGYQYKKIIVLKQ